MSDTEKRYVTVDFGPSTLIFLTITLLSVLKVMGYIQAPWYLILSPVFVVVVLAVGIILYTFVKLLKNYFFN